MRKTRQFLERLAPAAHFLRYGRLPGTVRDIPAISPLEVEEARQFFPRRKFFVFGFARSGTTLLMRLIDAHPDIVCMRQAHFFTRPPYLESMLADPAFGEWLSRPSFRWNRGRDLSPVLLRAAADIVLEREAARQNARIVGDKSPNNLTNGEAVLRLHRVYPDAQLIFIVRDGRDALVSHRFQSFIDKTGQLDREDRAIKTAFERNPERFGAGGESIFTESWLRESAANWAANVMETHLLGLELFGERYKVVRFQDLAAEPVRTLQEVWTFLKAETDRPGLADRVLELAQVNRDRLWQHSVAGESAAPIPKGETGSWKRYFTPRDRRIFTELAGPALIEWGFEPEAGR